ILARKVIVTETLGEPYPAAEHPAEQSYLEELVEESGQPLTRRRLFKLGLGAAGGALGLAALAPALSFGPLRTKDLYATPWRKGARLVDEHDRPLRAADIGEKELYTAFPEGADKELLAADRRRPAAGRGSPVALGSRRLRRERHRRVLEDLHPCGVRDLALPRAALSGRRAGARARLPVPLLDVRSGSRRPRHVRAGREAAADAAARDRRRGLPARRRHVRRRGRPFVVGSPEPEAVDAVIR